MSAPAADTKVNPDAKVDPVAAPATPATPAASAASPKPAQAANGAKKGVKREGTTKRFLSAYAQTWLGMTPLWLMGEAIIPGAKFGGTFKGGARKLRGVAEELRDALLADNDDVLVILDKHFHLGSVIDSVKASAGGANKTADDKAPTTKTGESKPSAWDEQSRRAAEVIRAAGESAIVAVSTSLTGAQDQIKGSSPQMKKAMAKHGKDVVVLVDKALKNPIVITGVSRFARSKGIPYSEGLLRLASMGLAKIIAAIPDELEAEIEGEVKKDAAEKKKHEVPGKRWEVEELDAEELERTSSPAAKSEADRAGKLGGNPEVKGDKLQQRKDSCIIC